MFKVLGSLRDQHDPRLVVLAGLICLLACFTASALLSRA
jgi:NO-binding membrane sensor protein with MHYT domain